MSGIKDQERLEEVRKRLYARGEQMPTAVSHQLDRVAPPVTTSWQEPPKVVLPVVPVSPLQSQSTAPFVMTSIKKKKGYRAKILLAGFAFFMLAVVLSSMFLLFGRGGISGENISISATGPFTVGGGEQLQLQVGIINDNAVPIESATLIVDYPAGTQSATEQGKELFSERLALKTIAQGEAINVPLRASVFGEENEEKIVKVSIEYRVKGSNATFFKEAESFRFKIGSSPIVVNTDVVKKISSGQETTVTLTIRSNSPTPLSEILVQAQYPTGFDFTKSTPASTHTESMWLIKNLEPQKETKITITGVVVGKETDEYVINFTVGVPNEKDPQSLASIFATAQTQFEIEQPFLDIAVNINSSGEDEIAVEPGKRSNVSIELTNTLEDTLYDMSVEVVLSGNAFSIQEVNPAGGYFDVSKKTIIWDVANTESLKQATPGEKERLSFSVEPSTNISVTPQVNVTVNAKARRVSENNVSEELVGTAKRTIKVVSIPDILGVVSHNNGIFPDSGPVPPVSQKATTYTVSFVIDNGSNEINDAIVTASLPPYVTWLNKVEGVGEINYNPTTRALEWNAKGVVPNGETYISFQVSVLPQVLQIGTTPTIVSEQRLKALDAFTGTVVRDTNPALTTMLQSDSGSNEQSGVVRAKEE